MNDRGDTLPPFRFHVAGDGHEAARIGVDRTDIAVITGANGMNSERDNRLLRRSWVSRRDGLARIERAPRARGPYSMRPT